MSQSPPDREDDSLELVVRFRDLRVTIVGPADQASDLLQHITRLRDRPRSSTRTLSPVPTEASFDFIPAVEPVERPRPSSAYGTSLENRSQILATFEECPTHFLGQSRRLTGSSVPGPDRVKRAWVAGQWAQAVAAGRVHSPNRSQSLDIRSRFYAVVRAERVPAPTLFLTAGSYWARIGDFSSSSSISHAFPSEFEAKVYFAGAGVSSFSTQQ